MSSYRYSGVDVLFRPPVLFNYSSDIGFGRQDSRSPGQEAPCQQASDDYHSLPSVASFFQDLDLFNDALDVAR